MLFEGTGTVNRRLNNYALTNGISESPWKPKKYQGPNLFVPRNENEEIILLLLISEAMAAREAVLSQSPEFKEARVRAFENATAVYDLLTVVVVRWSQVELLYEVNISLQFFFFLVKIPSPLFIGIGKRQLSSFFFCCIKLYILETVQFAE